MMMTFVMMSGQQNMTISFPVSANQPFVIVSLIPLVGIGPVTRSVTAGVSRGYDVSITIQTTTKTFLIQD